MGGNFPVSYMGHENYAADLSVHGILKVLPALMGEGNIPVIEQKKPVQKYLGEMVVLPPGTPEMIQASPERKECPVKAYADSYPQGKKEKIAGGNAPGRYPEHPLSQAPCQGDEKPVETLLHPSPH
jgi:hypothetical protein